jgi:hypothetical protein
LLGLWWGVYVTFWVGGRDWRGVVEERRDSRGKVDVDKEQGGETRLGGASEIVSLVGKRDCPTTSKSTTTREIQDGR